MALYFISRNEEEIGVILVRVKATDIIGRFGGVRDGTNIYVILHFPWHYKKLRQGLFVGKHLDN